MRGVGLYEMCPEGEGEAHLDGVVRLWRCRDRQSSWLEVVEVEEVAEHHDRNHQRPCRTAPVMSGFKKSGLEKNLGLSTPQHMQSRMRCYPGPLRESPCSPGPYRSLCHSHSLKAVAVGNKAAKPRALENKS